MKACLFGEGVAGLKRVGPLLVAVVALGAAAISHAAIAAGDAVKVRFGGDQTATRVVLDLDRSTQAKLLAGPDGGRKVVIEFPRLTSQPRLEGRGQGVVGDWSFESNPLGGRLTIALTRDAVIERRFLLAPAEGVDHYRYVIDLKATGAAAAPRTQVATLVKPAGQTALVAERIVDRPAAPSARKTIVIDAGHGGHDPGALGANVKEKEVTLAAAKALKARLEKTGRYRVVLTRDTDKFIPLDGRVQIARRGGADLFISLHADAGANTATRGASVYTLSDKGSTRVARNATANSDWMINVNMPGGTQAVKNILFDLTQRATRNKSAAFADLLINKVGDEAPVLARGHRDAGFVVLFAPDVPAVLLEMGFITNPDDEKFLTTPSERNRLVGAIAEAIDTYFASEIKVASR